MRFGQFPSSAGREQIQQMEQVMKPYNMSSSQISFKNFRERSSIAS